MNYSQKTIQRLNSKTQIQTLLIKVFEYINVLIHTKDTLLFSYLNNFLKS